VVNCRCTYAFIPRRDEDGLLIFKNWKERPNSVNMVNFTI
jgi:hypothetical protein